MLIKISSCNNEEMRDNKKSNQNTFLFYKIANQSIILQEPLIVSKQNYQFSTSKK